MDSPTPQQIRDKEIELDRATRAAYWDQSAEGVRLTLEVELLQMREDRQHYLMDRRDAGGPGGRLR